jgi:signal transduction histidine kinase/ligand-binding sensor domain-containing protein/AraC-like DNA-binding protein
MAFSKSLGAKHLFTAAIFAAIALINLNLQASRNAYFNFTHKDGLPHNHIESVFRDSKGFLWIATYGGISKFDGHSFQNYTIFDTVCPLLSNTVFAVFEDSRNNIWAGSNKRLYLYDSISDCFSGYLPLGEVCVNAIAECRSGKLWVGTFTGLSTIDINSMELQFPLPGADTLAVTSLAVTDAGSVIAGTRSGHVYVWGAGLVKKYRAAANKRIMQILPEGENAAWLATDGDGIVAADFISGQMLPVENDLENPEWSNYAYSVSRCGANNIWAVINSKLMLYSVSDAKFRLYAPAWAPDFFTGNKDAGRIYCDSQGNFWMSSYGSGLLAFKQMPQNFNVYSQSLSPAGDAIGQIRSIIDLGDSLLLASNRWGLHFFKRDEASLSGFSGNDSLPSLNIMSAAVAGNTLWAGTWGAGLLKIDLITGLHERVPIRDDAGRELNISIIRYIKLINDTLWIGSSGDGLFLYDTNTGSFCTQAAGGRDYMASLGWVSSIISRPQGDVWVSTFNGLYRFSKGAWQLFRSSGSADGSLSDDVVYFAAIGSGGAVWAGTNKGIDRYCDSTGYFQNYGARLGFPLQPRSFLQEKHGRIWVGTEEGLFSYCLSSQELTEYGQAENMMLGSFAIAASLLDSAGYMWFGASGGFVSFNPAAFSYGSVLPSIAFRRVYADNQPMPAGHFQRKAGKSGLEHISIPYSLSSSSISVADLNFIRPSQAKYWYRVPEFSQQWVAIDNTMKVPMPTNTPGSYTINIRGCYEGNRCSETSITVTVVPPWWKSNWFFAAVSIALLGAISGIYLLRLKFMRLQNMKLQTIIELRTSDLKKSNAALSQQNSMLKESELLMQIKNDKLAETLSSKDKLISVIAHDIKNPLAAMLGISDNISNTKSLPANLAVQVDQLRSSSFQIKKQLDNLLDWSRSQMGMLSPRPADADAMALARESVTLMGSFAASKSVSIVFKNSNPQPISADPEMVSIVLRNLLSNAIKFSHSGGIIEIDFGRHEGFVVLQVADTGVGMAESRLKELQKGQPVAPSAGTGKERGTGLGLALSRDFINANKGRLEIDAEQGRGCIVKIALPEGSLPYAETEETFASSEIAAGSGSPIMSGSQYSILIVDDNAEILAYLAGIFAAHFTVHQAENGYRGLEIANDVLPDLIIADHIMPGMSGLEFCEEIKSRPLLQHVPIILVSAASDLSVRLKFLELGAVDFLEKPFDKQVLFLKVRALLIARSNYKQHLKKQFMTGGQPALTKLSEDRFMADVQKLLEEQYPDPNFGVEKFAEMMGYSRSQLFRKIKSTIDVSPVEFLRIYRLKKAMEKIQAGYDRVSDIAYDVGFNDPLYFSTCFKNYYGAPPNSFIKRG